MADKVEFRVTFWGVRGSYPVAGKDTLVFGGNTTCLEVSVGERRIIIDAGTGIIKLGQKMLAEYFGKGGAKPLYATLLFTHLHHDHTQGLPFFAPLYLGESSLYLFGPRNFSGELSVTLERSMIPPNFPVDFYHSNSIKDISTIKENNLLILDTKNPVPKAVNRYFDGVTINDTSIVVRILNDHSHPVNGVLVYRIEHGGRSVVFATDVEGFQYGDSKLIQFAKDADLLIHDAQYSKEQYCALPTPKQGFGHSTPEMAIEIARKAGVKSLALTHHDPGSTDALLKKNQSKYRRRFRDLFYTREGMSVTVG
ncbi:MAG: MBL fold metallo-hydrolase [Spirochaetes bacterium]|nr:MBL fold metallo-hydrolase [Spirochaetota bacterium]